MPKNLFLLSMFAMIVYACGGGSKATDTNNVEEQTEEILLEEIQSEDIPLEFALETEIIETAQEEVGKTCQDECPEEFAKECEGTGYKECQDFDDDGCLEWSEVKPCGAGTKCVSGHCEIACQEQDCNTIGAKKCKDSNTVVFCNDYDGDSCLEWGNDKKCETGQICSNGFCATTCTDSCTTVGAKKCEGNNVLTCDDHDKDGCLDWGGAVSCGTKVCVGGACYDQCKDECTKVGAKKCDGNAYTICNDYNLDGCLEWGTPVQCNPDEKCSNGFCEITCSSECTVLNSKKCEGNNVVTCLDANKDGCLEWGSPVPCGETEVCNLGKCETQCKPECLVKGATKCDEAGKVVECQDLFGNGCLKWGSGVSCDPPKVCSQGQCALICKDECPSKDMKQCNDIDPEKFEVCGEWDGDGCLEWGTPQDCPQGKVCSGGECVDVCQDECDAEGDQQCSGNGYHICGDPDGDGCLEWGAVVWCKPTQECKEGECVEKAPPGQVIISELLYDSAGSPDKDAFLELWGPPNLSLTGYMVVGVNGYDGKDYAVIDLSGGKIGADGFFVIANPNAAQNILAEADLLDIKVDFQNGPDNVQVRFGNKVVDALAYGTFSGSNVKAGEGEPHPGTSKAGQSIGRDSEETDTNDNKTDFHVFDVPTPGAKNEYTNKPPIAQIICPSSAKVGEMVVFDGSKSSDPDGKIVKYDFDFGDGDKKSGADSSVTHAYNSSASYIVTLTVTDDKGATGKTSCGIMIETPENKPPTAVISCPAEGKVGEEITFDASGSTDSDGTVVDYTFVFGDGKSYSSNQPIIKHKYETEGKFEVTVTVKDDKSATAQASCNVTITLPSPPDKVISSNTELCGKNVFGKLTIQGGAEVTCTKGMIDIMADEVFIDPSSAINVSYTSSESSGTIFNLCSPACVCDTGYTGGGGGGNATAGESSLYTQGSARSFEMGGCLGSCVSFSCSGSIGGPSRGTSTELDAPLGGKGGDGCESLVYTCFNQLWGGKGGGSVRIIASKSINIMGNIIADGESGVNGYAGSGGGAGGSIVLTAPELMISGVLSAQGGKGGTGKKPSLWSNNPANGGAGSQGRIKLCYGQKFTNTGTIKGAVAVTSIMPPIKVSSSTHPDPTLVYNDTFDKFDVQWVIPFANAKGYWYALNKNVLFAVTPANSTYTDQLSMSYPGSMFTPGTWYFRVVATDANGQIGTVAWRFDININGTPHTVKSSSHPDSSKWYTGKAIALSWTPPNNASPASFPAFWYRVDRISNQSPEKAKTEWTKTTNTQVVVTNDSDGKPISDFAYYFHLVSEDTKGNLTKSAAHFLVQIGTEPQKMNFFGYVKDGGGNPIKDVSLHMEPYGLDQKTDANGYFLFQNIYQGTYVIKITKQGFKDTTMDVIVAPENVPLNVTMSQ